MRGIWFERKRQRYRVRIYRNGRVIHLSYHNDMHEAEEILKQFKQTADPNVPYVDRLINQTKIYYKQIRCRFR